MCLTSWGYEWKARATHLGNCTYVELKTHATHALARRARLSSPLSVWMESVPPDISYLVYVDVTT